MLRIRTVNKGFTLLEMVVSIFIIGIVLISLFKAQSSAIRLSSAGNFYAAASNLASQKLSEIEQYLTHPSSDGTDKIFSINAVSDAATHLSGDFGEEFKGYKWQCEISSFTLEGTDIPEDIIEKEKLQRFKKIDIEILYNSELTFKITSWKFIQPE